MSQFEVIETQLQQAQQETTKILSELEQVKQLQVQLKSQLDQVLSLVKPLEGLQLFDPSVLQSQLREIQAQLMQAQQERAHLQDQILEKLNTAISDSIYYN
jgi:chromosome segregation ATPase